MVKGQGIKILSCKISKQMLQRLAILLAQLQAGNISENLLNGIIRMVDKTVPHIKNIEVVLVHCNIANNQYDSCSLLPFVQNKAFGQLLNISPKTHIYIETIHSEFL